MRIIPAFLFLILFPFLVGAQCSDISIETLQVVSKAEDSAKEAKILSLGFDLHLQTTRNKDTLRVYDKCWVTNEGARTIYDQKIIWNQTKSNITFLTLNMDLSERLRAALDERHPSEEQRRKTITGKMFRYTFGIETWDGRDYYYLIVAVK